MKHFRSIEKPEGVASHPDFGICPRCQEEHFLSVPLSAWGMVCLYCFHDRATRLSETSGMRGMDSMDTKSIP